jgi:serine protease Do
MPRKTAALEKPDAPGQQAPAGGVHSSALGLTLAPVDATSRARWTIADEAKGAVVAAVDGNADAAEKGLQPGDVITRVNQQEVGGPADVVSAVERAKEAQRKSVLLLVDRQGEQHFIAVGLASA